MRIHLWSHSIRLEATFIKKHITRLWIIVVLIIILTSCTPWSEKKPNMPSFSPENTTLPSGQIELIVSTLQGPVAEKLKADAAAFSIKYPNVTFKFHEFEQKPYEEQGTRLFLSKGKPDVAWFWLVTRTFDAIESGAFEPLDDLYESEGWNKVLPASTLQLYTYKDGKKYGANDTIVWAPILYYNLEILQKLNVEIPKTIEDLFAIAPKLKQAGYIPLVSGIGRSNIAGHVFEGVLSHTLTNQQYKKLLDFSKKYEDMNYESPDFIDVFKQLQKMGQELFPQGAVGMDDNEARALFVQGKAAIYSHGSWAAGSALLGKELPPEFKLATSPYPQMRAGYPGALGLFSGNALWVIKGTGKEAWAKKFVAYAMSKESHIALAKSKGLFPSRTDLTDDDLAPLGEIQIKMYNQLKQLNKVTFWHHLAPISLNTVKNDAVQNVLAGKMTPEQAAQKMQETFDNILKNK
jgi:ABC-type glycerol-3-phosphate transport system substrate-binding protein